MKRILISLAIAVLSVPAIGADFSVFDRPTPVLPPPGNGFGEPTIYIPEYVVTETQNETRPPIDQRIITNVDRTGNQITNNYYDIQINNYGPNFFGGEQWVEAPSFPRSGHRVHLDFGQQWVGVWHRRPFNETFDWYMSNILGNPWRYEIGQQVIDLNGDGLADFIYTAYLQNGITIVSTWINTPTGYDVFNEVW